MLHSSVRLQMTARGLGIELALTLVGCTTSLPPIPSESADASVVASPSASQAGSPSAEASPAVEMPEDVILLRAFSGPWRDPTERNGWAPAEVAVYGDGTVLANVSPVYPDRDVRAIRLGADELVDLMSSIDGAAPIAVDRASSVNSGCADAGVQVIRVRLEGRPLELAVYCLNTRIPLVLHGTPESAVTLSRLLDDLQQLVSERPAITTDKQMPLVPAASHTGG